MTLVAQPMNFLPCYDLSVRQPSGLVLNSRENSPDRWNQLKKINWNLRCRATLGFDLGNEVKFKAAEFCLQVYLKCKKGVMYIWNINLYRNLDRNTNDDIQVRLLSLPSIPLACTTDIEVNATAS